MSVYRNQVHKILRKRGEEEGFGRDKSSKVFLIFLLHSYKISLFSEEIRSCAYKFVQYIFH